MKSFSQYSKVFAAFSQFIEFRLKGVARVSKYELPPIWDERNNNKTLHKLPFTFLMPTIHKPVNLPRVRPVVSAKWTLISLCCYLPDLLFKETLLLYEKFERSVRPHYEFHDVTIPSAFRDINSFVTEHTYCDNPPIFFKSDIENMYPNLLAEFFDRAHAVFLELVKDWEVRPPLLALWPSVRAILTHLDSHAYFQVGRSDIIARQLNGLLTGLPHCVSGASFVTTMLLDSFHTDLIDTAIKDRTVNPANFLVDPRSLIWKGLIGLKFVDDFLIGVSSDLDLPLEYIFNFLKLRLAPTWEGSLFTHPGLDSVYWWKDSLGPPFWWASTFT